MATRPSIKVAVVLALGLAAGRGWAQEKAGPPEGAKADAAKAEEAKGDQRTPVERCAATATLRVQLVIARLQNEKKQASLPYTFVVPARPLSCPERKVRMRMGVETPVPVTSYTASESNSGRFPTSFQYKNVGTNIDCSATDLRDGRYQLSLYVENSSALASPQGAATSELSGVPIFRTFSTSVDPILRDGQSLQTVASTDPVTGEVVKIDVTLNVVR
jgi:hypothetical protein